MTRREREPFAIRGHHLHDYQEFLLRRITPARYSNDYIARLIRQDGPLPLFPEAAGDIDDVLGTTLSKEERFKKVQVDVLRIFRSLPNDTPVELTQTKDAICGGCAVGKHCDSKKQVKGDRACIYFFIEDFDNLDSRTKLRLSRPKVIKEGTAEKVQTTMEVVRRVLRSKYSKLSAINPFL